MERSVRLLTADELGLIKVTEGRSFAKLSEGSVVSRWGEPNREKEITCLGISYEGTFSDPTNDEVLLAAGRKSGALDIYNGRSGVLISSLPSTSAADKDSRAIRGLHSYRRDARAVFLSTTYGGTLRVHSCPTGPGSDAGDGDGGAAPQWQTERTIETKAKQVGGTSLFRPSLSLAVGGESSDLAVWDLNKGEKTFQAKGGKPNNLGLLEKPSISCLTFVPGTQGGHVAVGTGSLRKLRLYDIAAQKRPVAELVWGKEGRITAVAADSEHSVWAANSQGMIQRWDMRVNRIIDVLKGPEGSIRSLHRHPEEPLIASVGLDRFLRVHNTDTRALVAKIYLKQQMTAVMFCPGVEMAPEPAKPEEPPRGREEEEDEGEGSDAEEDRGPRGGRGFGGKRKERGGREGEGERGPKAPRSGSGGGGGGRGRGRGGRK